MGDDLVTHIEKINVPILNFPFSSGDLNERIAKTFYERGNYII